MPSTDISKWSDALVASKIFKEANKASNAITESHLACIQGHFEV